MKLQQTAFVIAVVLGAATAALAQSAESKAEPDPTYAFFNVGRQGFAGIDADAPSFGGWMLGGGFGYSFHRGWFVEGVGDQLVNYRSDSSGDHGDVTTLTARFGHKWGRSNQTFRPFVAFAIGKSFDRWQDDYGDDRDAEGLVAGPVLGGDFRVGRRFFVRPEVSVLAGMGEAFARGTIGIGYRF